MAARFEGLLRYVSGALRLIGEISDFFRFGVHARVMLDCAVVVRMPLQHLRGGGHSGPDLIECRGQYVALADGVQQAEKLCCVGGPYYARVFSRVPVEHLATNLLPATKNR